MTRTLAGHADEVTALAVAPDGLQLASASQDQTVRLWNMEASDAHRTLAGHRGPVWAETYSPDGRRIATGGADRVVRVWTSRPAGS